MEFVASPDGGRRVEGRGVGNKFLRTFAKWMRMRDVCDASRTTNHSLAGKIIRRASK